MAKGLPGRNTLLASVSPTPKPEAEPATQAAVQPVVQPIIQTAFHPEAAFRREPALHAEPQPPQAIFASYVPDTQPAAPAVASPLPEQAAPLPERKHFVYANAGGDLPLPKPALGEHSLPLYQSAEVVGAPEADEDHPEETSYVPFEIAGLMSNISITYNHVVARLTHPEQKDLSYLFEGMDRPLAATFRTTSGYQGLAAAQTFSGRAVATSMPSSAPPGTDPRGAQVDPLEPARLRAPDAGSGCPMRASGGLRLGHAERVEIGVEHRHLLPPLVLILLADADHGAQRLHVEAIALRLGIDLAKIGGERRLLLLEPLDAGDNGTKLVFG